MTSSSPQLPGTLPMIRPQPSKTSSSVLRWPLLLWPTSFTSHIRIWSESLVSIALGEDRACPGSLLFDLVVSVADVAKVEPLPVRRAFYDLLPWDVVTEFRAQLGGGFGLVHKRAKQRAAGVFTPPVSPMFGKPYNKEALPPSSLSQETLTAVV